MSNTTRWGIAIVLILGGLVAAVFSIAFLGFFTWECYGPSNSIAYTILYVAAVLSLIGGIVPAVLLIRRAAGKMVLAAVILGAIFALAGNAAFMYYALNIC